MVLFCQQFFIRFALMLQLCSPIGKVLWCCWIFIRFRVIFPQKRSGRPASLFFCLCDDDFFAIAFKRHFSVLLCHTQCTHHANRQTQLVRKILFFFLALIKDHSSFCGFFFHLLFSFYIKKAGDARLFILRLPACPLLFAKTPPGSNFPFFCTPRFCQKAQISLPS